MLLTWTSVQTNANMSDLYENSMNHSMRIASDPDERYEMGVRFDGNQTTGLKTLVKFDGNLTLIRSLQLFATLCNSLAIKLKIGEILVKFEGNLTPWPFSFRWDKY